MGAQVPTDEILVPLSPRGCGEHAPMHFSPWCLVVGTALENLAPVTWGSEFLPKGAWQGAIAPLFMYGGAVQPQLDLVHIH